VADHELTRTQRNAVLALIVDAGLDPAGFRWDETNSSVPHGHRFTVQRLVHRPTGYWFQFDVDTRGSLIAEFVPGNKGSRKLEDAGSWQYVLGYATEWTRRIREEHETPDLWAEVARQRELIGQEPLENTDFEPAEKERIVEHLTEAKAYARANLGLDPGQLDRIEAQLDYLIDYSKRARRIDWRNAFLGSFVSLALQAVVPVGPIQQLLTFVLRGLSGLFGGPRNPKLPGGPPTIGAPDS
jgi:hypothetical protein